MELEKYKCVLQRQCQSVCLKRVSVRLGHTESHGTAGCQRRRHLQHSNKCSTRRNARPVTDTSTSTCALVALVLLLFAADKKQIPQSTRNAHSLTQANSLAAACADIVSPSSCSARTLALARYLGDYVEGLDRDNLQVAVWEGAF